MSLPSLTTPKHLAHGLFDGMTQGAMHSFAMDANIKMAPLVGMVLLGPAAVAVTVAVWASGPSRFPDGLTTFGLAAPTMGLLTVLAAAYCICAESRIAVAVLGLEFGLTGAAVLGVGIANELAGQGIGTWQSGTLADLVMLTAAAALAPALAAGARNLPRLNPFTIVLSLVLAGAAIAVFWRGEPRSGANPADYAAVLATLMLGLFLFAALAFAHYCTPLGPLIAGAAMLVLAPNLLPGDDLHTTATGTFGAFLVAPALGELLWRRHRLTRMTSIGTPTPPGDDGDGASDG